MNKIVVIFVLFLITISACKQNTDKAQVKDALQEKAVAIFGSLVPVAENPDNAVTDAKVVLGQALFFDKRLSKEQNISCNSCHNLNTYGVDNMKTSPGDDGTLGDRNSPTVLNAALHIAQFWDGRAHDVEEQAGGPVLNPVEMAMPSEKIVVERLNKVSGYKEMFAKAFPDENDPINYSNMTKAIGAFERKLITPSKFDNYLAGDLQALSDEEKSGLQTFMDKGCITCHSGPLLGGTMFQKFGLFGNYWEYTQSKNIDEGKFKVTGEEADKYIFKVPSLRNIEKTFPYFHDGSISDLHESISIMGKTQLNQDISTEDLDKIALFLKALTGEVPEQFTKAPEISM
ncbi:MAG: cytochrome-c peroxidase [Calditrichaeota bacterium]|nr:cytochrome-c peroxidase [Calditrichota bacterium]